MPPPDAAGLTPSSPENRAKPKNYMMDAVFDGGAQEDIFEFAMPMVCDAVSGYNACIFAYGCTGSGKTHTMSGPPDGSDPGIIPRAIELVFAEAERKAAQHADAAFLVRLSFVELYNDDFRDLLSPHLQAAARTTAGTRGSLSRDVERIKIREGPRGPHLTGSPTLRSPVRNAAAALSLIKKGLRARATGRTNLNEHSSRSHAIVTIEIEGRERLSASGGDGGGEATEATAPPAGAEKSGKPSNSGGATVVTTLGNLHLIDLAGSERLALSGADGDTMTETQSINLSLTTLCDVLSTLAKNAQREGADALASASGHGSTPRGGGGGRRKSSSTRRGTMPGASL